MHLKCCPTDPFRCGIQFAADTLEDCSAGFVLIFVAIGVFLIVISSMRMGGYRTLLHLNNQNTIGGNYVPEQQDRQQYHNSTLAAIMSVYWPTITCLYLIWSFLSFDWWITWIVWPIAAIVESLIKNISKTNGRRTVMKRNVYLILITVITILCIIAGTGYHLVRFGLSVAEGLPSFSEFIEAISDWNDDGDDSDDNDDSDNGISTSVDASQKNLDAFSSINADLNVVDLTIQRGNTFSITCKASKKLTPEYKVENNCLTITQYAKAHNALGRNKNAP